MKTINKYKLFIYYFFVIFALLVALDIFPIIQVKDKLAEGFSAARVADDIKCISKQPHSIQHPKERKAVRDYLYHRLEQMGGKMAVFNYDSIACNFGGHFDIANVYAQFDPVDVTEDTQYLLFIAHLDSRFFHVVITDTVYSYGAADDGYGLGVALESVKGALKYRNEWKQGIKVLFTDSEEHELDGMRNALDNDRHLFDNVNFIINIEARGVKGKALLFETSSKNEKLMELYRKAEMPRGFSLTTLVYSIMPNFTDFIHVKDSIPGMNFAVIDNLKYYHTNLDNFANISLSSIQHYGLQIEPVVKEYLASAQYSSVDALRGEEDTVFFALPLFGLFVFSQNQYLAMNVIVWLLLILTIFLYVQLGGINFKRILKWVGYITLVAFMVLGLGELIAYGAALVTQQQFSIVALKYVKYDDFLMLGGMFLCLSAVILCFKSLTEKYKYFKQEFLLGTLFLIGVLSAVMYFTVIENFFFLFPVLIASLAMLARLFKCGRWVLILSMVLITAVLAYFIYLLYIALTIGAMGILLMLWLFYVNIAVSHYYDYKEKLF